MLSVSSSNPFAQAPQPLQCTVEAMPDFLDVLELLVEDIALAITRPMDSVTPQLIVLIDEAQQAALHNLIAAVSAQQNATPQHVRTTQLSAMNWVEKVQKDFPPFCVERFYIYGSYHDRKNPANTLPLCIDAAAAFGTGEHETTAGCLRAIARFAKKNKTVSHVLDMGCGTAILAIAAAKCFKMARIVACDNDAKAVEVTQHNLRINRVHSRATSFLSDGYMFKQVRDDAPYPLIIANILARPLMKMAKVAAAQLAPGGTIILSGVMRHQVAMVMTAYRAQGLRLDYVRSYGRWSVIVFCKA